MSDKLQRARHIRPNPPDPTDRNAAPLGRHGRPSASGDGDAPQAQGAPRNNPRANAEARIPARGRHRGVDKTLPGATGLIPVVGSHAGLDRTIPGATAETSIRQQEVIVAEAAETEVANRGGEGGGALLLETLSHARARGAVLYGVVAGCGNNSDAYHVTAPEPSGTAAAACMRLALQEAGLRPDEIGYINAHGTGTLLGDAAETAAMKLVPKL